MVLLQRALWNHGQNLLLVPEEEGVLKIGDVYLAWKHPVSSYQMIPGGKEQWNLKGALMLILGLLTEMVVEAGVLSDLLVLWWSVWMKTGHLIHPVMLPQPGDSNLK